MNFDIKNIIHYINNDEALKQADNYKLEYLVKKYEYSGFLQLLYCKYLKLNNDIKLEKQLEKCSLVVSDRKKVYELIFKEPQKQTKTSKNINDNKQQEKIKEPHKKVEAKEKIKPKTISKLEEEIIAQAVNASIQIDVSNYEKNNVLQDDTISIEKDIEDSELTFLHWLKNPTKIKEKPKTNISIIDSFLKKSPKKIRTDKTISQPTQKANKSLKLENNTQFATETLATIYAKQGQIDKAIEIYKQLCLKIPEKKTFFASRIRFLKEKQQYNK